MKLLSNPSDTLATNDRTTKNLPLKVHTLANTMKLRSKIIFKTAILASLPLTPIAAEPNSENDDHIYIVEIGKGYSATVKLVNNDYFAQTEDELLPLMEGAIIHKRGDELISMDVNEDGYKDIFLKVMDARAGGLYALYLAHVADGKLRLTEQEKLLGSPYLDDNGLLISIQHNGPYSHIEKYASSPERIYRVESRDPINSQMEKVVSYDEHNVATSTSIKFLGLNIDVSACIKAKTYLHRSPDSPDDERRNGYLIAGDIVHLKDATPDGGWFNVLYTKSNTTGWIQQHQIDTDCSFATHIQPISDAKTLYRATLQDLNNDGTPEVLIPLADNSVNKCVAAFTPSQEMEVLHQIDFFAGDLCNPTRRGKFLISKHRSGARWFEDIYAIENDDFKITFSDSCLGCDWVSRKEYYNNAIIKHYLVNTAQKFEQRSPLLASISVANATIYKEAGSNSTADFSLKQGDIVLVKNTTPHDNEYFVEVESIDTPTVSGWIECKNLSQCDSL